MYYRCSFGLADEVRVVDDTDIVGQIGLADKGVCSQITF